jgi:hypothetical protein
MTMNDLPREILKDMVGRYGRSLAQDPARVEGLLRDSCSKCYREIFVLVNAARQRVPADLVAPRHALPMPLMKGFLTKRLQDELGFSDEASRWAVESWADALGIPDSNSPAREEKTQIPQRQKSPADNMEKVFPEDVQCERWIDELKNGTTVSRLDAITGLSHSPGRGCLRALAEALDNSQIAVREAAFDALSLAGERAVPVLVEMLADERDGIAWRSALLLGGLCTAAAVPGLMGLLERNGKVRLCAIWALGEIGNKDSVTPLMKFIDDTDPAIREETITALKKIGGKNLITVYPAR